MALRSVNDSTSHPARCVPGRVRPAHGASAWLSGSEHACDSRHSRAETRGRAPRCSSASTSASTAYRPLPRHGWQARGAAAPDSDARLRNELRHCCRFHSPWLIQARAPASCAPSSAVLRVVPAYDRGIGLNSHGWARQVAGRSEGTMRRSTTAGASARQRLYSPLSGGSAARPARNQEASSSSIISLAATASIVSTTSASDHDTV